MEFIFETTGKQVEEYLAIDLVSEAYSELVKHIPPGWKALGAELLRLYYMYGDETHIPNPDPPPYYSIKLEMGLLRILVHTPTDKEYESLWEMVSQQTARASAFKCMICGNEWLKGQRRKREPGMPSLCREHYIHYINYLAEKSEV